MYAIIATGGKQYKVAEGDIIKVEKLGVEAGETYTFDQVLAVNSDKLVVGNPTVEGATVTASVIGDGKAKKVVVYKYKRKTGYHKKNGHRQQCCQIREIFICLYQSGEKRFGFRCNNPCCSTVSKAQR